MKYLFTLLALFFFGCQAAPQKRVVFDDQQAIRIPLDFCVEEVKTKLFDSNCQTITYYYTISSFELKDDVREINEKFADVGISFYVRSITRKNHDALFDLDAMNRVALQDKDGIFIYVYSYYNNALAAGLSWLPQESNRKGIWIYVTDNIAKILCHELGHYFGLRHSFDPKNFLNDVYDREAWLAQHPSIPYFYYPNMMNYTAYSCADSEFTDEQRLEMRECLFVYRQELLCR